MTKGRKESLANGDCMHWIMNAIYVIFKWFYNSVYFYFFTFILILVPLAQVLVEKEQLEIK